MPRIKKKFEDTTGAIRRRKSMKDRQYIGQNNDLQNTTQKNKDKKQHKSTIIGVKSGARDR